MPIYSFRCYECNAEYEELVSYDETDEYADISCPECESVKKEKLVTTQFAFSFANPVGTDRYNNSHDYRYKHKAPQIATERDAAEKASHMGAQPYNPIDDVSSGKHFGEVQ